MGDVHHCSGPRLRHDLYYVEWDVKLQYTIPYHWEDEDEDNVIYRSQDGPAYSHFWLYAER